MYGIKEIITIKRVIFIGGNFREKLEEALRIKFCGFKFRGVLLLAYNVM